MTRVARLLVVLALAAPAGCGDSSSAKPPATDPESIRQLEELQKQASQGERNR